MAKTHATTKQSATAHTAERYAPFNTQSMRRLILALFFIFNICNCYPQILNNSLFRIYRAEFIQGAVTQLRLDKDSVYLMSIAEIHCSLCDHEMLANLINSKGIWSQLEDTIYLQSPQRSSIKLLIKNDSLLKPLFPIGINLGQLNDSTRNRVLKLYYNNPQDLYPEDFHLIYDTYPNGVARFIFDKYRSRRNEYEIGLEPNGSIKNVKYFWDGKQSTRIR